MQNSPSKPGTRIVISRTDSLGDVVLTLPVAGVLKSHWPDCKIIFLGRSYTRDLITACEHVDEFIAFDQPISATEMLRKCKADIILHVFPVHTIALAAFKSGIPLRVGTTNRIYHWYSCNKLVRLSRKNSPLHEAQLNLHLLKALGIAHQFGLSEIPEYYGLTKLSGKENDFTRLAEPGRKNVILHPCSKGSAREWGIDNFEKLIALMPADRFRIFITGTAGDREKMGGIFDRNPGITDLTGRMKLRELIGFIAACDALVAASTGPLHIAAALGKRAIGLYSARKPIHAGRWGPVGIDARVLFDRNCPECAANKECDCITRIPPASVLGLL
jgi:heptosyltransferase-3